MFCLVSRLILAMLIIMALASPAQAHKPTIIVYASNGWIYTECCFKNGLPASNCKIELREARSQDLLRIGTTNEEGQWSFSISQLPQRIRDNKIDLLFTMHAGIGHKAKVRMPAAQYLAAGS